MYDHSPLLARDHTTARRRHYSHLYLPVRLYQHWRSPVLWRERVLASAGEDGAYSGAYLFCLHYNAGRKPAA